MGSVLWISRMFHMSVSIGPGTDRLSLQRLKGIFRRHLTGDHTVQVFLQQHFIDRHNSLLRLQKLHLSSVRGCSLRAIAVLQDYLPCQHIRDNPYPIRLKIRAVKGKGQFLSRTVILLLQIVIGTINHRIIHVTGKYGRVVKAAAVI